MFIHWDSPLRFHPTTLEPSTQKGIPVPYYGLYGGPGNSGPGAPVSTLDALYQAHDNAYDIAQGDISAQSKADAKLIQSIFLLDQSGGLSDPEDSLYGGFSTLAIVGNLALHDDLDLLGASLPIVVANAIDNWETGLAGAPSEGRGLHGAVHAFEAHFGDFFF